MRSLRIYKIENRFPTEEEIAEIIELMNKVWGTYYFEEGMWYYDRNLLDMYLKSPRQLEDCYVIVKHKETNKVIGFCLMVLWEVNIYNKGTYSIPYGALITVDTKYQKQGIGKAITRSYFKKWMLYDFIGGLGNIEETSASLKTLNKVMLAKKIPLRTTECAYIRPLNIQKKGELLDMKTYEKIGARLIQGVKKIRDERIRKVELSDIDGILKLLNSYSETLNIARIWSRDELMVYTSNPMYRGRVFIVNNEVKAVFSAIVFSLGVKGLVVRLSIIENCHYANIPLKDQRKLIRSLLFDLKLEGVTAAIDFNIKYRDLTPLKKERFMKYPRRMTTYLFTRPELDPSSEPFCNIKSDDEKAYIEVI